jgi:hypothetical protein
VIRHRGDAMKAGVFASREPLDLLLSDLVLFASRE